MLELFSNTATTTLAGAISNTALTASLSPGSGSLFPSPAAGEFFRMTFNDAATTLVNEIVYVTARSGDVITMIRGQEGTAAQNWLANDLASNLWTAGSAGTMLQAIQQQTGQYVFGGDTGSANTIQVAYSPVITALTDGMVLGFRAVATNTGATTFSPNGITPKAVYSQANSALVGAEIQGGYNYWVTYDLSADRWYLIGQSVDVRTIPGQQVYSAPGVYSFARPAGVSFVRVRVWGAGGGGAQDSAFYPGPSGGGEGGYWEGLFDISALSSVSVTVGTGGAGGAAVGNNGNAGTASSFGTFCSAQGGGGGIRSGNSPAGGTATGVSGFGWQGGYANPSVALSGGAGIIGGMGGGGWSPFASSEGSRPPQPGAGGGGRLNSVGAAGAHGCVIINWG